MFLVLKYSVLAVDFADLAVIDLSKLSTPGGQSELVQQLRRALLEVGFFYVINHGYTPSQVKKMLSYVSHPLRYTNSNRRREFSISLTYRSTKYQMNRRRNMFRKMRQYTKGTKSNTNGYAFSWPMTSIEAYEYIKGYQFWCLRRD